jgi:hypothetical protein
MDFYARRQHARGAVARAIRGLTESQSRNVAVRNVEESSIELARRASTWKPLELTPPGRLTSTSIRVSNSRARNFV